MAGDHRWGAFGYSCCMFLQWREGAQTEYLLLIAFNFVRTPQPSLRQDHPADSHRIFKPRSRTCTTCGAHSLEPRPRGSQGSCIERPAGGCYEPPNGSPSD